MPLRLPKPLTALKHLGKALTGSGDTLYRLPYETDKGDTGILLWVETIDGNIEILKNTHRVTIADTSYDVTAVYKTTVEGRTLPVKEVAESAIVADSKGSIEVPFTGETIPPQNQLATA